MAKVRPGRSRGQLEMAFGSPQLQEGGLILYVAEAWGNFPGHSLELLQVSPQSRSGLPFFFSFFFGNQ